MFDSYLTVSPYHSFPTGKFGREGMAAAVSRGCCNSIVNEASREIRWETSPFFSTPKFMLIPPSLPFLPFLLLPLMLINANEVSFLLWHGIGWMAAAEAGILSLFLSPSLLSVGGPTCYYS